MRFLFVGIGALLLLTGCGHTAIRYTWAGDETKLPQVNLACARDMQKVDSMDGAAKINPFTGKLVGGAAPDMYKACVEKYGYRRTKTDNVALGWDERLNRWRPEPACGKADQTCVWVEPNGEMWGIAPLPRR